MDINSIKVGAEIEYNGKEYKKAGDELLVEYTIKTGIVRQKLTLDDETIFVVRDKSKEGNNSSSNIELVQSAEIIKVIKSGGKRKSRKSRRRQRYNQ